MCIYAEDPQKHTSLVLKYIYKEDEELYSLLR